ncbi:ATP-dependent Clp protease ATP-binding subunit ClpA [Myxococcus hansupus]|uniref:ATP-dependent Clp protease ATP-binding subunit ClpA n=1 Tax=Pseudomyxococcus hansupus TaxID=1297742 RepID=A0A0H4WQX0_9BACT|nr:AAA family ATPase [Myxococcus hansupus]AKQ65154.1 ATP-dependent Clp protease ATP-binding subunit ClpA [Myxococcus hansupus]
MNFRFQCWLQKHVSGRVTLTPLALRRLAVHADSLEAATEELTLALDDQLSRIHPRRVPEFIAPAGGTLETVELPALPVWGAEENHFAPLTLSTVVAPTLNAFLGLHAPRLDSHHWFQSKTLPAEVQELLGDRLVGMSDAQRLALRPDGAESLLEIEVRAKPLALADLTPRELHRDIRLPPRPPEAPADAEADSRDDDAGEDAEALDLDSWEPRRRTAHRGPGEQPAKPPPTPTLDSIGVAWHRLAQEGQLDAAYEQEALVDLLRTRFAAKDAEPVVLVGPSGVGKTSLLHALAQSLRAPTATEAERARPFYFLDGSRLIAGDGFFGDWQQQVLRAFREATEARALLSLGHAVELLDAGKSAHSEQNVAQLLLPLLAARDVAVVAEATEETWAQVERRNTSFARLFSVVRIAEPTPDALGRIVAKVAEDDASATAMRVQPEALEEARFLCRRFLPYGAQVGNTVAFVRRLLASCAQDSRTSVTRLEAIHQFASESGIPEHLLRDDQPLESANVRAFLSARVLGQDAAVERAASVVSVLKAGMSDTRRPLGVLLFVGPTGVGKTELSKALAELLFGAKERMVRLDMGEYAGPDALLRLMGDGESPGYLTSEVRRQPFCVVLLDEVEKAHPAVHDALLGVLGEGRLTDASGRFTDFRNALIILTSNLGADTLRARVGFDATGGAPDMAALRTHYLSEVQRFFRPELFNRLDDVVVFSPLAAPLLRRLVVRELEAVCRRPGLSLHDAVLDVTPAAQDWLALRGFDARYGARPLKRALERELVVPVAGWLAAHRRTGPASLTVDAGASGLELRAEALGGAAESAGRESLEQILEEAATVRAEVQRWSHSPPMSALRRVLAVFDKVSRNSAYWAERSLAEDSSRKSAEARELDKTLRECSQQAEAIEDLLFEAHLSRTVEQAESLGREVRQVKAAFARIRQRIYSSRFPPSQGVTLYLVPGRGAWKQVRTLAAACEAWVQKASLEMRRGLLATPERKPGEKAQRTPPPPQWRWANDEDLDKLVVQPVAYALQVKGGPHALQLAGEHGLHRFIEGSQISMVHAYFEPRPRSLLDLSSRDTLQKLLPRNEVRQVRLSGTGSGQGTLTDLRTGVQQRFGPEGPDLEPLQEPWMQWHVFNSLDED